MRFACPGFHVSHFPAGHGPTDFARWWSLSSSPPSPLSSGGDDDDAAGAACFAASYTVAHSPHFEPYVLTAAADAALPWYDERFAGYGMNKVVPIIHTLHLDLIRFERCSRLCWKC